MMMDPKLVEEIIGSFYDLPTLPGIALRILEEFNKEEPDIRKLSEIISTDPPLSAKVLELINSAIFSLPQTISALPHAIQLLGVSTVKNLALGFSIVRNFKSVGGTAFDYPMFWKNSLIGAVANRLIMRRIIPAMAEDAFAVGLLRNIGMLVLNQCLPQQYSLVIGETQRTGCAVHEAEKLVLGFTHMEVSELLLKSWNLPDVFTLPIRFHHDPDKISNDGSQMDAVARSLYVATIFVDFFRSDDKTFHFKKLQFFAHQFGFLGENQIEELAGEIQRQTQGVLPLFDIAVESPEVYLDIIDRVRTELAHLSRDCMRQLLERNRTIQSLREQTRRDSLTELYNYQRFYEVLDNEVYRAKRYGTTLAVGIGDIDFFKQVNDRFGHLAGDCVLQKIAQILADGIRKSDTVARYGGEEFAFLLPGTGAEDALRIAQRMGDTVAALVVDYEGKAISATMSFGVAVMSPHEKISKIELLKRADSALYKAKGAGRKCCCLY